MYRSLANQRLLQFIVEDYGVPQWDLNHLNQFGRHNCGGGCADCRWDAPGAREKAMVCVDLARKLWKENAEELKASKAGGAGVSSSAGAASDLSGCVSTTPSAPSAPAQAAPTLAVELGPQSLSRSHVQGADQGGACEQARGQANAAGFRQADSKDQESNRRG